MELVCSSTSNYLQHQGRCHLERLLKIRIHKKIEYLFGLVRLAIGGYTEVIRFPQLGLSMRLETPDFENY